MRGLPETTSLQFSSMTLTKMSCATEETPLRWSSVKTMIFCKLLKRLVPRAGVEPARPYGQRILSLLRGYSPQATTRYQAVFTDVSAVKASYVWLGIGT